jgi:polyamine oxidase
MLSPVMESASPSAPRGDPDVVVVGAGFAGLAAARALAAAGAEPLLLEARDRSQTTPWWSSARASSAPARTGCSP